MLEEATHWWHFPVALLYYMVNVEGPVATADLAGVEGGQYGSIIKIRKNYH